MTGTMNQQRITKLSSSIPGLDHISNGGLPEGRSTLVSGTAGSAKTVFAIQFLAAGIMDLDQHGVFVTFEETPEDIRKNMSSFNWDIAAWEAEGKWKFVDASPSPDLENTKIGRYDLGAFLARIEYAVKTVNAKRLCIDSLSAIFSQLVDPTLVRSEVFRIVSALRTLGVTALITAERTDEYGEIARYGVEEFVTDNVIVLRNVLEEEKRRRTIEILKFRGTDHNKGEFPFTILPESGISIIPLSAIELKQRSSNVRITSGNEKLDRICNGGFFRDSIIMVSGATGTGKTLMVTEFIDGGAKNDEKCLLFAFEESREQMLRNAEGWGVNFARMEDEGKLQVVCLYPEVMGLEDHLVRIKEVIEEFQPNRVAVDSLSALERVSTMKGFREFVIGITSFIKHHEIAGFFTSTTPTLMGGTSITETHISTITDLIILLRYVEMYGEMRRGITVLKMRGSMHEKDIREFVIDAEGMHIKSPFREVTGILTGYPQHVAASEMERIGGLFSNQEQSSG